MTSNRQHQAAVTRRPRGTASPPSGSSPRPGSTESASATSGVGAPRSVSAIGSRYGRIAGVIDRYTLPEMGEVWSEAHKYALWCRVETLVLAAHAEAGTVPAEAV